MAAAVLATAATLLAMVAAVFSANIQKPAAWRLVRGPPRRRGQTRPPFTMPRAMLAHTPGA
eukprot:2324639-Lingulodinium_polyedra.AAC.1